MEALELNNLLDIDSFINDFIQKHEKGIATMHCVYFHNSNNLAIRALIEELKDELRTGCVTFMNKESEHSQSELDSYLFYITNSFIKNKGKGTQVSKRKTEYLCPGCLFLGKENLVTLLNKFFRCDDCEEELCHTTDPKKIVFFRTFFKHHKMGYHCEDCDRFIPHPVDDSPTISCPYYDCAFVGSWFTLSRMHHPNSKTNIELLTLDSAKGSASFKDKVITNELSALDQLENEEVLVNKVKLLNEIIECQSNNVHYSSSDFTIKHKYLAYQAFKNLLKKSPVEMVSYLLESSRSGGFQHKAFQEYIKLLEESLPFNFKKNNKLCKVESLLDDNLNLFEGISIFEALTNSKLEIKNNTKEFYIGGRKASYTKPYYIGKLLSVSEKCTKKIITDKVTEYSFSKIKMKDIAPGTEVVVTHLRIPPHYEMGGMVYINRVRKKIVERSRLFLSKGIDD